MMSRLWVRERPRHAPVLSREDAALQFMDLIRQYKNDSCSSDLAIDEAPQSS
jgi:hypothetical protein